MIKNDNSPVGVIIRPEIYLVESSRRAAWLKKSNNQK
jgi:hypothetical protein